jgi:hypothetical protein
MDDPDTERRITLLGLQTDPKRLNSNRNISNEKIGQLSEASITALRRSLIYGIICGFHIEIYYDYF